jgi:hypothetical protein
LKTSLRKIFDFLRANRIYNKELQTKYYSSIVRPQNSKFEKVVSLLYEIANTQAQPKIDYLADFFKKVYKNEKSFDSFAGFLSVINQNKNFKNNYHCLYKGMKTQKGWGDKTSALFAKTIFHIHNKDYPKELKIWDDAPTDLAKDDILYQPVDAVITAIFNHLENSNWTFRKVNKEIRKYYSPKEIEVWDDLWFWGFITQNGTGNKRKMQWNLNKYWALRETDKDPDMIKEIHTKAEKFLDILNSERD